MSKYLYLIFFISSLSFSNAFASKEKNRNCHRQRKVSNIDLFKLAKPVEAGKENLTGDTIFTFQTTGGEGDVCVGLNVTFFTAVSSEDVCNTSNGCGTLVTFVGCNNSAHQNKTYSVDGSTLYSIISDNASCTPGDVVCGRFDDNKTVGYDPGNYSMRSINCSSNPCTKTGSNTSSFNLGHRVTACTTSADCIGGFPAP